MKPLLRLTVVVIVAGLSSVAPARVCASVEAVVVSVATDRETYHVGEPIDLTMTVKNGSDEPIRGHFILDDDNHIDIVITREGERPFLLEKRPSLRDDVGRDQFVSTFRKDTLLVEAQKSRQTKRRLLTLPGSSRLTLDREGKYQILVVCKPWPDQTIAIRSEPAHITILSPEGDNKAALTAYLKADLPRVVQSVGGTGYDRDALGRALQFMSKFPSTPLAIHVREAVRQGLRVLVSHGMATEDETRLLEQLQMKDAADRSR